MDGEPAVRREGPDGRSCVEIVRRQPDFFTPDVPDKVRVEMPDGSAWVVDDVGRVVARAGQPPFPTTAEIRWIAIVPERRGGGIGTLLPVR